MFPSQSIAAPPTRNICQADQLTVRTDSQPDSAKQARTTYTLSPKPNPTTPLCLQCSDLHAPRVVPSPQPPQPGPFLSMLPPPPRFKEGGLEYSKMQRKASRRRQAKVDERGTEHCTHRQRKQANVRRPVRRGGSHLYGTGAQPAAWFPRGSGPHQTSHSSCCGRNSARRSGLYQTSSNARWRGEGETAGKLHLPQVRTPLHQPHKLRPKVPGGSGMLPH